MVCPCTADFLKEGSRAWSWWPCWSWREIVQDAHLKHFPLLQDGLLANPGLGCKLLEKLMNFEDASIFLSVSNPEQLSKWLPYLPLSSVWFPEGSIVMVFSLSQNSFQLKWKPFWLPKVKQYTYIYTHTIIYISFFDSTAVCLLLSQHHWDLHWSTSLP